MKKIIFVSAIMIACLTACNEDYNEQFNIIYQVSDVKGMNDTLSTSDYGAIADNPANQLIATEKDPTGQTFLKALAAVKKDKYFTDDAPAETYIPAFLASKFPNADIGSKFVITYNQYLAPASFMADFGNISHYDLSADDYKSIWEPKSISASFLSPLSIGKIPVILQKNITGANSGDMVVVNYAYSQVEPSTGGAQGVVYDKIKDVIENKSGANYTVKGDVVATYGRGFLINDGTASILVYVGTMSNCFVGDVVTVSGTTSAYSGLMQFPGTSEIKLVERKTAFSYPSSVISLNGAALDSYMDAPSVKFVSISGTLSISGSYYNLKVDGATRQGSISYPVAGIVDAGLNGKNVTVTGYLIGGSAKYVNVMATSVVENGQTLDTTPIGIVALSDPGNKSVSGVVSATYGRGFLVTDGTGNILVYIGKAHEYKVGDMVTVSGTTSKYSGLMQFPNSSVITKIGDSTFKQPAPRSLSSADMEAYITAPYCALVSYTGTLKISGTYYNVVIDGTTAVQGSLQYPIEGTLDASLDGKKIIVTGYAIGVSSGKYLNTMTLSVTPATAASVASRMMVSSRSVSIMANSSQLYVYSGSEWKEYTNSDANIGVITPDVYTSIGSEMITVPENVIPAFLHTTFPYVGEGDKAVAIYKDKSKNYVAVEYTYNKQWSVTPLYLSTTLTFAKDASGISANMSTYIDESFLGDAGGFTIKDVTLGALTYVWTNTGAYGWKATAYLNSTNNVADSYIVSPSINFTKAVSPIMTFDHVSRYLNGADPGQYLSVLVSTDYKGDPSSCTWHKLSVPSWADGSTWDFINAGIIDLSAYKGSRINIAFHYTSDTGAAATWEVKNLKVFEKDLSN